MIHQLRVGFFQIFPITNQVSTFSAYLLPIQDKPSTISLRLNNLTCIALCALQGNLEEGLKRLQELIDQDPRDFRPYICQVSLSAS